MKFVQFVVALFSQISEYTSRLIDVLHQCSLLDLPFLSLPSAKARLPDGSPAAADKLKYRLYGIVEHSGSLRGGHYVAYVRVGETRWVYVSDAHTSDVSMQKAMNAQASLLFYELVTG